jgi:hypothetical protein
VAAASNHVAVFLLPSTDNSTIVQKAMLMERAKPLARKQDIQVTRPKMSVFGILQAGCI